MIFGKLPVCIPLVRYVLCIFCIVFKYSAKVALQMFYCTSLYFVVNCLSVALENFGELCPVGDFRKACLSQKIAFQNHSLVVVKAAVFFSLLSW